MRIPQNLYRMTTATSIGNSGTGTNALTKPAGAETASILLGKKHSNYIPTQASFTTDFNSDVGEFTIFMYTKPNIGIVMQVAGHQVEYTGYSYVLTNEVGDRVEIPTGSNRSRIVMLSFSAMEVGLSVDGIGDSIGMNTLSTSAPLAVTLLHSGGILDNVVAMTGLLTQADIINMVDMHISHPQTPYDTIRMSDEERDIVRKTRVLDSVSLVSGQASTIQLPSIECQAVKIVFHQTGPGQVAYNGTPISSGFSSTETPLRIDISASGDMKVSDVDIYEYYSPVVGASSLASYTTDEVSGNDLPIHLQDDVSGNIGDTVVTMLGTANTISGWFYAGNGNPMPGVSMNNGVLTGTGLYVNGKSYVAGTTLRGWYFLSRVSAVSTGFTVSVPVHSMTASAASLSAAQIDDLYESFFGNATLTAPTESMGMVEHPAMIISTEWNIVSSG